MVDANALGKIGVGNLDLTATLSTMWVVVKWLFALGLLGFIVYWFLIRPMKYKDHIDIWEKTSGGTVVTKDRGGWLESKTDKSGYYGLLKNKRARLKNPNLSNALITKRGKKLYTFLKYGDSPFDYCVVPPSMAEGKVPEPFPLADEDWAKHSIKKAAEKNTLGGWFNENKGFLISVTAIVMSVVLMITLIPAAKEAAVSIAGSNQKTVDAMQGIADQLENVANELGGTTSGLKNPAEPPPGI
jgi:hypothetical protein